MENILNLILKVLTLYTFLGKMKNKINRYIFIAIKYEIWYRHDGDGRSGHHLSYIIRPKCTNIIPITKILYSLLRMILKTERLLL